MLASKQENAQQISSLVGATPTRNESNNFSLEFSLLLLLFLPKVLRRQIFLFLQIHWNFFIFQFISEICKSTSNVFLSFKCSILSVESPTFLFSLSIFHRFFKKSNKHFLFLKFLYSFCFPPSQISQASNISFPPISLPPFPQLSRFFRVPGESQGERERETSRRARKKGISRLYPLTAGKKGNGYSLPPPFTRIEGGLRETIVTNHENGRNSSGYEANARKDAKKLVAFVCTRFRYIEATIKQRKKGKAVGQILRRSS